MTSNSKLISTPDKEFLYSLSVDFSADIQTMAIQLRQIMVSEWIENSSRYEGFLPDVCIQQEAPKFLIPGNFYGPLADTMLTALCNALQTPIIVFSSIECHPFFCITPQNQRISVPVIVAYTQFGPGHYDGVAPKNTTAASDDADASANVKKPIQCNCGKNDKEGTTHCQEIQYKYTTTCRCPCLKKNIQCTDARKCKNCSNPHGQRPPKDVQKRKRFKHDWQEYKMSSSIEFAEFNREKIVTGPFTKLEYFILENILRYCDEEDISTTRDNIHSMYTQIIKAAIQSDPNIPISHKNISDIEKFLVIYKKSIC